MSVTTKLAGFLVVLLTAVGGGVGIGKLVGPVGAAPSANHAGMGGMDMGGSDQATAMPEGADGLAGRLQLPPGLRPRPPPGTAIAVSFAILGPDGRPVTKYDVEHDKELHLIAVRRDFTGFQHVHPVMAADGTWTTTLDLTAGQWRLFADFKATGAEPLTLGNDLAVSGNYLPAAAGADSRTSTVDGYTVTLNGDLAAGAQAKLTLTVTRNGKPVTDLEPYLGAYGHLVSLRVRGPCLPARAPGRNPRRRRDQTRPRRGVLRRGPERRALPPLPQLQTRRCGADRRIHRHGYRLRGGRGKGIEARGIRRRPFRRCTLTCRPRRSR